MSNIITLTGEGGHEYSCEILDIFEFDGQEYGLLLKLGDESSTVLMRLVTRGEDAVFRTIEDDAEFERVTAFIRELANQHPGTQSRDERLSAKWLACQDPCTLTAPITRFATLREWRLCLVAFCRRVPQWQSDDKIRAGIGLAERLADGGASEAERLSFLAESVTLKSCWPLQVALEGSENIEELAEAASTAAQATGDYKMESAAQCDIIRDILGNPFQPVKTGSVWRAAMTVPAQDFAATIYAAQSFEDMDDLGEVLQQAGMNHPPIQNHCSGFHLHVRGCWLLDGLLGKRPEKQPKIINPRWAEDWLGDE